MASVFFANETQVDYSIVDGRVMGFRLDGQWLFDEDHGIDEPGWRERLRGLVVGVGLDVDRGHGLHAFVKPLFDGVDP